MRDPYLYEDAEVLRNKLDIRQQELLDEAEADYVVFRLKDLALNPLPGDYHIVHFLKMHEFIFQDIFEWAGKPRTISIYKEEDVLGGQSIEYSDPFDIVRDLHHVLYDMRAKEWKKMSRERFHVNFVIHWQGFGKYIRFEREIPEPQLHFAASLRMKWIFR